MLNLLAAAENHLADCFSVSDRTLLTNPMANQYDYFLKNGGYKIVPKIVIKATNAVDVIRNITSNDLDKPSTAFLNRFGKLIALADQTQIGNAIYIVIEATYQQKFLDHVDKFFKLANAEIKQLEVIVLHVIGPHELGEIKIQKPIGYLTFLKDKEQAKNVRVIPDEVYEIIRLENNIPQQGIDFDNDMFLETGLESAVSYSKGCYLGQEVIARVHNLTKPGRKLVRILYDKLPKEVTINGERVGKITSSCFSPKHNKFLVFSIISNYGSQIDHGKILPDPNTFTPRAAKQTHSKETKSTR